MAETFIPPVAVAINARQALDVRANKPPSQRGMTPVGLARASQLANRKPVSLNTIRRMAAYFARHEVDKQGSTWDSQGAGWQAWMGWGGDEGRAWAKEILQKMGDGMEAKSYDEFNTRQRMLASALLEVTHEEGKFDKSIGANGAHYVPADENPFIAQGMVCHECYFYQPEGKCAIVDGEIEANAICKLWIIPEGELMMPMDEMPMDEMPQDVAQEEEVVVVADEETVMEEMKVDMTAAEREALPDMDFAIPSSRNFPITTPESIMDAVSSWGRYEGDVDFETFKQNLIKIALRNGQAWVDALPESWKEEMNMKITDVAKRILFGQK